MPSRPDLVDLAIAGVAFAVAFFTSPHDGSFLVTLAFTTAVLTVLGLVVRLGVETGIAAVAQSRRTRELGVIDPDAAARQAVVAERERLSSDVEACIREALLRVGHEVDGLTEGEDPRPRARRIQAHAREASSELRRQLGLLRTTDTSAAPLDTADIGGATSVRQVGTDGSGWFGLVERRDLLIGGASAVLAAVEAAADGTDSPDVVTGWSVILTVLAAATLVGRRTAAPWAALVCAAIFAIGWTVPGGQVASGAWMMCTLGGLLWTLGAARQTARTLGSALVLSTVSSGSRVAEDPDNVGILVVTLVVAWTIGAVVGRNRRRHDSASVQAAALQSEIDTTRERALRTERLSTARDLHDVVSHAVGVIATQAAAAEVSWPADPATSRRALTTVADSVDRALAEIDRTSGSAPGPVPGSVPVTPVHDLDALVARLRGAGTEVTLHADPVPPAMQHVVYRIVQESLTNAIHHAPGARVDIRIDTHAHEVSVQVADNGPGPAPGRGSREGGFGLTGVRERAALLGGTVRTGRPPGGGFVIEAHLPVRTQVDA